MYAGLGGAGNGRSLATELGWGFVAMFLVCRDLLPNQRSRALVYRHTAEQAPECRPAYAEDFDYASFADCGQKVGNLSARSRVERLAREGSTLVVHVARSLQRTAAITRESTGN